MQRALTIVIAPMLLALACTSTPPPSTPSSPSNRVEPTSTAEPGAQYVGNPRASVALTYWFDYQCSHCVMFAPVIDQVATKYGDRIVIHYKNFQLARHPDSRDAAIAAEAARRQGQFIAMYKRLIARSEQARQQLMHALQQGRLTTGETFTARVLRDIAAQQGLDLARFDRDIADPAAAAHVDGEYAEGEKQGLEFVPALFINGALYERELTAEAIGAEIDARLGR